MRRALAIAALLSPLCASAAHAHGLVWPDVPERIERGLASPDPAARRTAARDLSTLGAARATPLVLKALADADVEVRIAAAQSAIRLRVPEATDVTLQWLAEREMRLRLAACEVAQAMPRASAVPTLGRAVGDPDPLVRSACADALGALPPRSSPEAVAPLTGKLDDPTPAVRIQIVRALAHLGDPRAVVPLVGKVQDSVPEVRQAVVRALGDLGDTRATQALLLALRDNVPEVKIEALAALGRLRAPDAVDALAPLAIDRNPGVRQAALVALGRVATPSAVRALVRALGAHEDAAGTLERTPVREALVMAGPPAAAELTGLLERPVSPAIATSAAWVLGELRATASAPAIVAALRKGTLPAPAALRALAGAGGAEAVPVALEFIADASVRDEALRATAALLDPERPDGRAVEPLVATLKNPRLSIEKRAEVARLLGRTGAPRAATELAGLVNARDASVRLAAIDALGALGAASVPGPKGIADDTLATLLGDADPAVRLHAAVALGESGGPRARSLLIEKLDAGGEVDRYALFTALGGVLERAPDEAAARRLLRELAVAAGPERDAVIEAAGRCHLPVVVQALGELASNGDVDDRRMVAAVLAGTGGASTADRQPDHALANAAAAIERRLLDDGDRTVRAQAAFALGAVGDASTVPPLVGLVRATAQAKSDDARKQPAPEVDLATATNAAGAIARIGASLGRNGAAAIASALCPALGDARGPVRANALAGLAFVGARCGDGHVERALLTDDPSELVRTAAARVLRASPSAEDASALERCSTSDRNAEVARMCEGRKPPPRTALRRPHAVTVFILGETGNTPRPGGPFLLEYEGGILRAGVADRRGATFEPAAPAGDVLLRRVQAR